MIHGFATAARLFNKGIEMNFISSKRSPTPVNDGPLGCVSESAIWSALVFCGAAKYPDLKDELYRAIVEDTKTEHLMEFTNHGN